MPALIYFPVALDVNFAVPLAAVTRRSLALAALLREAAHYLGVEILLPIWTMDNPPADPLAALRIIGDTCSTAYSASGGS